jgi:hypothetical protein
MAKEREAVKPWPKIIKLRLETHLKSQAPDLLNWHPVTFSANQMFEILDRSPDLVL